MVLEIFSIKDTFNLIFLVTIYNCGFGLGGTGAFQDVVWGIVSEFSGRDEGVDTMFSG